MATIRKRGMRWQVQVRRSNGYRASRSFLLRADAERWAREAEAEADRRFLQTDPTQLAKLRLSDLLRRYEASVTPAKRSAATERQFLAALLARPLAQLRLVDLTPRRLADYRDERLSRVRPASVLRELALLQHVLEVARREWGVGLADNPCRMVAKPSAGPSRQRRIGPAEWAALCEALQRCRHPLLGAVLRFAIETGMRRSELLRVEWRDLDEASRTLRIRMAKNGHPRTIALSEAALAALAGVQRHEDEARIFPMSANALRLAWERLKRRAGIEDLRFHDLRHEAISRLFEKGLNVPEVAVMSGHRDPRMLFRYTHPRPEDIARKLAKSSG